MGKGGESDSQKRIAGRILVVVIQYMAQIIGLVIQTGAFVDLMMLTFLSMIRNIFVMK